MAPVVEAVDGEAVEAEPVATELASEPVDAVEEEAVASMAAERVDEPPIVDIAPLEPIEEDVDEDEPNFNVEGANVSRPLPGIAGRKAARGGRRTGGSRAAKTPKVAAKTARAPRARKSPRKTAG